MKAIVKTGYKGYVAQEFLPTGKTDNDKEKSPGKSSAIM
jgi:hydroxypyruvate isomerase